MRKKLLSLVLGLVFLPMAMAGTAYAASTANINIRISGAMHHNDYFLCLPNVGCLSIAAAQSGKVYPVFHPIKMSYISVVDVDHRFRLSNEGLPSSCNVTVQPNQSISIYGHLVDGPNQTVILEGLHCSVA